VDAPVEGSVAGGDGEENRRHGERSSGEAGSLHDREPETSSFIG
jgi:hypothetical protein